MPSVSSNLFRRRTIARDLTLGLAISIVAVTVSLSLMNYFVSVARTERRLDKQATDIVDRLSAVLSLPLWNVDTEAIKLVAEAYQQTENVVALRVLDEARDVIYANTVMDASDLITAKRAIRYLDQHIGQVEVSLTRRNILAIQQRTLYVTLVIMFCVILSVVVVTQILLKVFLTKPLGELTQGIEKIAGGSYDHFLPPVKQADVDTIIQEVNSMAAQIAERDKALRESKERYEELANLLPETVYEIDENGNFTFLNHSGFESFGYSQEDLEKGLDIFERFIPEDRVRVGENIERVMRGEKIGANEYTVQKKDGSKFPVLVHSSHIMRGGKTVGLRAIAVDITDRKSIEEELGKLAAGIAHQVRNPVMTIGGFALRLQKRFAPDDKPQDWLKIILEEVRRLERMVSDIHRHTGLARPELRHTSLKAVLEALLSECQPGLDSQGIRVKRQFPKETSEVLADANLLELAFRNIVVNAREAMPDGGELELAIVREGDRVRISVKDVGVGIAPEDLPNVFDPFFSSKPLSSGLGLTTAQRIISEHKGEIKIRSIPGKGTEVRIWLTPARPRTISPNAESS